MFRMKNLIFAIILLLVFSLPAQAKPLNQYLVNVKYALYIDVNNNMQMDMIGTDICVRGGTNSPLTWAIKPVGGSNTNTSTTAGTDYIINGYDSWLNCHQFDAYYNPALVEKTWYTLSGCGGYLETIYIGSYVPDSWYSVAHRVTASEPNC